MTARIISSFGRRFADFDPRAEGIASAELTNAGTACFEQLCHTALGTPAAPRTILYGTVVPN